MSTMDRRSIIGTIVKAKAIHVCDRSECSRRFGASGGSFEVYGVVLEVVRIPNVKTGRSSTAIKAEYDLFGGYKKIKTIGIRCVIDATEDPSRPGYRPATVDNENDDTAGLVTDGNESNDNDNIAIGSNNNNNIFGDTIPNTETVNGIAHPTVNVSTITPTKRKRKDNNGHLTHSFQGRCRVCKNKTTYQCSVCKDDVDIVDEGWICNTKNGAVCFSTHLNKCHDIY